MFESRRLKRQLAVVTRLNSGGPPAEGWGPTLEAMVAGRHEFAGRARRGAWKEQQVVAIVYSNEKTRAPGGIEVRYLDENGDEIEDDREGISSGDWWGIDHLDDLLERLDTQHIEWFDPVKSFGLAYL